MADNSDIRNIVGSVVAEVLEDHLPGLREELTARVLELLPQFGNSGASTASSAEDLLKVISLIHAGTTQKEILRALLEGTVRYCGRAALFVVKAGAATGWQGRAFEKDNIKDFPLDVNAPVPARVLETRVSVRSAISEMDPKFIAQFGAPAEDLVFLFPLLLKDKIAALVYADGGDSAARMDAAALELLVAATSAWLEVASLRKQAAKEGAAEPASEAPPAPVHAGPSFSDPFAGHAPRHAVPPPHEVAAPVPVMAASPVAAPAAAPVLAAPVPAAAAAAAAPAPARDELADLSPQDAEVHRKAQRFARLLMDEIKLYNQAKVADGRKGRDLYDRLKDDIEKSRATYLKRYGNTSAASKDYFTVELIRSLAQDDVTLLGPNFRR